MDCFSIYQLLTITDCGCVRQSIREWQSWMVLAYRTRLHVSKHLVLAKNKFDSLKHVSSYVPPLPDQPFFYKIMTSPLSAFIPWSFNWCHEYVYPTCDAGTSISCLKIVTISRIASGLVLFLRANPNLRNLFFRVLSEISRLWYAAKDFTVVTDESNK